MQFAITYLLVAGAGIAIASSILRKRPDRPGLNYLRAALIFSSALLLGQVLAFLIFGTWFISPPAVIAIGFIIPGAMQMIT